MTVGHQAILHGCTIGDQALVGMGARVLNGAVIGANCLVGAGALVTEGKCFEPGMLIVGAPARAVRPLTEAEIARAGAVGRALCAKKRAIMPRVRIVPRAQQCGYIADT